ncbi:MAG: hypothetical protein Tsb0026_16450 [Sulfuricaulis sp.]
MTGLKKLRDIGESLIARASVRWILLLLVSAAIIATAASSYREIDKELTAVALLRRETVTKIAAVTIAEKFGRVVDVAISLSTRVRFRELVAQGKWTEAIKIMQNVPQDLPHIERLFLTDAKGTLQADMPALPQVRGVNFAFREWYQGVSRDWRPYVSPVYIRAAPPQISVFAVAVPVRNAGNVVVGVLVLQIRVESLLTWINTINTGKDGFIYVVDSKGQVAFHSRHRDRPGITDLSGTPVVEKLLRGEHGVETGLDPVENEEANVAYAPVPGYGWGVVSQQPLHASLAFITKEAQLRRLLTGYGFILALCALAIVMASRIATERKRTMDDRRMKAELEQRVAERTMELTQANELLRTEVAERERAEHKFRELLESAPDAIVIADQEGHIVLVNSQAERWFGYARGELIDQPVEILLPERLRQRHAGHRADYLSAPRARPMGNGLELFGRRRDGSEFPVEISLSPIETVGGVWVTSIIRDITERRLMESERRASEARFRAVADTANDAIISADSLGRVIYFNKAGERIFGYTAVEILHQPLTLLMPPRFHATHEQGFRRFLAGGESRVVGRTVELAGKRKNGEEFPLELSLSTWKIDEEIFFTGILRDITQRRQAEESIRQLNGNLEQRAVAVDAANKELEAFSYSVSHDLRAPLRSIDGFGQALLEDCADRLDDQGRQHLQRIRSATQRMGTLIDDLLMLSRVTRAEMRREPVDLSQLAQSVITGLEINEPGRKVECQLQTGMMADGDPHLMRIVLENLLGNAWKFTQRINPARIEMNSRTDDSGAHVYCVRDNGAGFDMTYTDKLFGAFQRLHAASDFPGTGIGLATVQRIIQRHGGRVWAEGEIGKGASFYFTLGPSTRSSLQENPA